MLSLTAFAKPTKIDFSQAINEDLEQDIKKDDEKFKKEAARGPASVSPEVNPRIEDTPKLDKNIRQIGPNKW
jgi:hypothetical protein